MTGEEPNLLLEDPGAKELEKTKCTNRNLQKFMQEPNSFLL